ncbi:MAG: hypothetical protein N3A65_02690 [candidate division WOR-3 bacterium]|nr:hypothetical protein [candidate division WOR-3 bacterium]
MAFIFLITVNLQALEIYPKNIFLDHYEIIPPLGRIKSIATSLDKIFAISDNYLLIFDKNNFNLLRTTYFSQEISLVAYDPFYDELWVSSVNTIIRYNISLGSVREYKFNSIINGLGFTAESVYISSQKKYALERNSGNLEVVSNFPEDVIWYRCFDKKQLNNYVFLTPYFYQDDLKVTNNPFHQYEITALHDDGMYLYVGTDQYGILRYNKISLTKERIIYGPLTTRNLRLKKIGTDYYFISEAGISFLSTGDRKNWCYFRLLNKPGDFLFLDGEFLISFGNQIAKVSGVVSTPITHLKNNIITINHDGVYIYVGTKNGMYKILKETDEPFPFGPDRYPVYFIYPSNGQIFVGGEFATYRFDRKLDRWFQILPCGTKDICALKSSFYFLTHENQLIRYTIPNDSIGKENDTLTIALPYFNIYDIDSDGKVLYCATGSGINYFNPETQAYNPVYNLPRIKYDYVAIVAENIIAISDEKIYRLPLKYRD